MKNDESDPDLVSVQIALQMAWQDYRHARDQTWKILQMEAVLGAGLVTIDAQFQNPLATGLAGSLVALVALFGVVITIVQRDAEVMKWTHIYNLEKYLKLHREDLLPIEGEARVGIPKPVSVRDCINPRTKLNCSIMIFRLQVGVMLFAVVLILVRAWSVGP